MNNWYKVKSGPRKTVLTIWIKLSNRWKNLSRFWSARERRLQARIEGLHRGIGKLLVAEYPEGNSDVQPDEDRCEIRETPKMFPDQENGYLG